MSFDSSHGLVHMRSAYTAFRNDRAFGGIVRTNGRTVLARINKPANCRKEL
jgi:hypothetical protein